MGWLHGLAGEDLPAEKHKWLVDHFESFICKREKFSNYDSKWFYRADESPRKMRKLWSWKEDEGGTDWDEQVRMTSRGRQRYKTSACW